MIGTGILEIGFKMVFYHESSLSQLSQTKFASSRRREEEEKKRRRRRRR